MKKLSLISSLLILNTFISAQNIKINKIEPPNWWEGMKHNKVQLMVYGEELSELKIDKGELKITGIHEVENGNYLFVDVDVMLL